MSTDMTGIQPIPLNRSYLWAAVGVGLIVFVCGLIWSPERAWASVLLVSFQLIGVGAGAAFLISALYCSGASWGVALRRVPEAMTRAILIGGAGLILLLIVYPEIYPWAKPTARLQALLIGFKGFWLERWFFLMRTMAYLGLWIVLGRAIVRNSQAQDIDGAFARTRAGIRKSGLFLGVFAATFWLAAFDWVMSLEPEWYSTIFGIYSFSGWFLTTLTVVTLLVLWLEHKGPLRGFVTEDHLHDLGKLVFAFSTFWMYIWFSQYMLIWYANIPEETGYFTLRHHGVWGSLALLNLFLNWIIPFFTLLSRRAKRDRGILARICSVLLVGRLLDVYLMVVPPVAGPEGQPSLVEIGVIIGGIGGFLILFVSAFGSVAPVPKKDPLLSESLTYHQ